MRGLVATLLGNPTPFTAADLPLELVRRHLLAPLAYKAGVAAFRNDYIVSSLQAERRALVLAEALDALGNAGIPVILLKGIAYAGTIYPDPAERPMSDIDLLVRSSDMSTAEQALARLGYWRAGSAAQSSVTRHAITLKRRDGSIDLHRHILHAGRSRMDMGAIWREAVASPVPGARRPSPLHEYLLHAAHIGRHEGMVPLVNYTDAARLGAALSPAAVMAQAGGWRIARTVKAVSDALVSLLCAAAGPAHRYSYPSADEIVDGTLPPRWLQLTRKLGMVDDWLGVIGFALATVRARLAARKKRS